MRNDYSSNYLMHHGILGQKWGIRRYQNTDGSLTPAGRERYGVKEGGSVNDISSPEGSKKRVKDLKKAIRINEKKRGKEYTKIANNPENFLGQNKKHAKKISEYTDNIKKGEEEIKRLMEKNGSKPMDEVRPGIHDENNENHKVISEKRMDDGFGKIPSDWKDVYSGAEADNISFSIQAIGKSGNDVEFRIHNHNSGISNSEAAKKSKEFLDVFDDAKARKAIADEYYPYVKDHYPNVTKGQFENGIEAYSVDTYPKWDSYEVHYDDGGYLGGHSLDIEGDIKTGKIKGHSMNG